MNDLIKDPAWMIPVGLTVLGLVLGAIPLRTTWRNRRAKRIEGAITEFLTLLRGHRIVREGLEDRFRADPKKMEAAVYDIRSKLNATISILERERYKNRSLLTQMQRACNEFLDEMDDRKEQAATSERHEEFFDSVFPALERWQGVLCANSQQLCTEHGLSGQPLCDELC